MYIKDVNMKHKSVYQCECRERSNKELRIMST